MEKRKYRGSISNWPLFRGCREYSSGVPTGVPARRGRVGLLQDLLLDLWTDTNPNSGQVSCPKILDTCPKLSKFLSFGRNLKNVNLVDFSEFGPDFRENRRKFHTIAFIFVTFFYETYNWIKKSVDSLENHVQTRRNMVFSKMSNFT